MKWNQRCQAEVDLSALRRNYRRLRGLLAPEQKYLAVVKADAYGHGAVRVALTLEEEGGSNTVQVEKGRIRVSEADCPDQICVNQGWISGGAVPIVCLPHRLMIEIVGGGAFDGGAG